MILVTHAIVGSSLGALQSSPAAAFFIGLLSHYFADAIPHYEYSVEALITNAPARDVKRTLLKIAIDGMLGVFTPFSIFYFAGKISGWQDFLFFFAAILGAMLPDAAQGFRLLFPQSRILSAHQKFHNAFHSNISMKGHPVLGVFAQIVLCVIFIAWATYFS